MKQWLLFVGLQVVNFVYCQENNQSLNINDPWFRDHVNKGLQIGDTMPDISLGTVINNYTGKTRFSDFKGKLLILDFWSTTCSSCLHDFPYMKKMQEQFSGKIQILLVNTAETRQQITESFNQRYKNKIKLPDNLPSIVADSLGSFENHVLFKLFPYRRLGQHIWIDKEGIIRLIGEHENTNPEKIVDFLAGRPIQFLYPDSRLPSLSVDRKTPYYKQLGSLKTTPVVYGSFITPYTNELEGHINFIIDSANKTRTMHFINIDVAYMYEQAFNGIWKKNANILYSPLSLVNGDLVIFPPGTDTLNYSSNEDLINRRATDRDFIKSKYCYEQVVSINMPFAKRQQYMVEDLNRFFEEQLGTTAVLEKRKVFCYSIVRTSKFDKVSPKSELQSTDHIINLIEEGGRKLKKYKSVPLISVFQLTIQENPKLKDYLIQQKRKGKSFLLINETGWDKTKIVNMALPAEELYTINDLRKVLNPYDLNIVEKESDIEFIVFKKQNHTNMTH